MANKGINEAILLALLNAANRNNYVCVDDPVICKQLVEWESPEDILLKNEKSGIIKRSYESLSDEAKQVIAIVIDTPSEMLELISSPITNKVSKDRIARMLRNQWGERKFVAELMEEITMFVKLL
jgi:hypothetical protein